MKINLNCDTNIAPSYLSVNPISNTRSASAGVDTISNRPQLFIAA